MCKIPDSAQSGAYIPPGTPPPKLQYNCRESIVHPLGYSQERKSKTFCQSNLIVCVVSFTRSVHVQSCLTLCDPMDCSPQVSLSMGFSRQEYWSGLLFPSPGHLPDPGVKLTSSESPALADRFFTTEPLNGKPHKKTGANCYFFLQRLFQTQG